jgi:hypothetical protein
MTRGHWIALGALIALAFAWCLTQPSEEARRRSAAVTAMAANWSGQMQYETTYDALAPDAAAPATDAAAGQTPAGFNPNDDYFGLPRNPGYEDVSAYCSACHSLQLVMQQNKHQRGWNQTIDLMVARHGMPAPPAADRQRIVDYLARNFGVAERQR